MDLFKPERLRWITGVIVCILSHILPIAAHSDTTITRMSMRTGEVREIHTNSSGDIQANKRGILAVAPGNSHNSWQLTALKPGFVVLKSSPQQWLITVKKPDKVTGKSIPRWICKNGKFSCNQDSYLIKGRSDSWADYWPALLWCDRNKPCLFLGTMSQVARLQWKLHLRELFPSLIFSVSRSGLTSVTGPCHKNHSGEPLSSSVTSRPLLAKLIERKLLLIRCQEDSNPGQYRIQARVILLSRSQAVQAGFEHSLKLSASLPASGAVQSNLLSTLRSMAEENKAKILAEPLLIIKEGKKGRAKSGGEMPVYLSEPGKHPHKKVTWKSYGIVLQGSVYRESPGNLHLTYEVSLSLPGPAPSEHLSSEFFKSEITVSPGQTVLAGRIGLNSHRKSLKQRPVLEKIPLLGPLFRGEDSGTSDSELTLWFEVSEVSTSGSGDQTRS